MPQKMRRLVIAVLSLCSCSLTPTVVKHEGVMGLDNEGRQRASVTLETKKKEDGSTREREIHKLRHLGKIQDVYGKLEKARQRRKEMENESLTE